ncbi:MAG TPA: hypothetical protein VFV01_47945 [Spirillospora sp.]|nr:hypothetical protein [Spirillospora sp.]
MTGPEHYRVAERLLAAAGETYAGDLDARIAAAQVHATLAVAAATAAAQATAYDGDEDGSRSRGWSGVA